MNVWDDMFGGFFSEFDKFFGNDQTVPCDVVQNKDKNGDIVSTDIQYALAGYDKENITIDVKDNRLFLTVAKTEETDDSTKEYLHKGISHRRIEAAYDLSGYNKDAIGANFENGILKLSLPVKKESETKKIEIK
jgi:HSP20 family molecular chaperone IbpA